MDDAIYGSYFSESYLPSFCFSINTLWSQPHKKIGKIMKSEKIKMEFYLDPQHREEPPPLDKVEYPMVNSFSNPGVQLTIHSPYMSPSPYKVGQTFLGGRKYEIKLKQDEKHLLPPPYQTNCTDYMPAWRARGGIGPLNQLMVIQECKLNASLQDKGCVPFTVDYPHSEDICSLCVDGCNRTVGVWDHCTHLLENFNQPCDSLNYGMEVEEKVVETAKEVKSVFLQVPEKMVLREMGYNCTQEKMHTRRCHTVQIDIVFDSFEITNITYNPKFESLEIFSAVGGYMGMYLGISILAVYDFAQLIATRSYNFLKRRRRVKKEKHNFINGAKILKKRKMYPLEYGLDSRKRTTVHSYDDRY